MCSFEQIFNRNSLTCWNFFFEGWQREGWHKIAAAWSTCFDVLKWRAHNYTYANDVFLQMSFIGGAAIFSYIFLFQYRTRILNLLLEAKRFFTRRKTIFVVGKTDLFSSNFAFHFDKSAFIACNMPFFIISKLQPVQFRLFIKNESKFVQWFALIKKLFDFSSWEFKSTKNGFTEQW